MTVEHDGSSMTAETMAELVADRSVIVCCGPGGVGKTTVAGAVALAAARRGRRAVVVTVDPARRLADALGLGPVAEVKSEEIEGGEHRIEGPWPGELWATMLDPRATFDHLVRTYAPSPARAEAILANRFYRNLAGTLSGTQEYMGIEKLVELHDSGRFDVVVVDTPPTRNALDFLDAPARLGRFLESRAYRILMAPARSSLRVVGMATSALLRGAARVVGSDVIDDAAAFFGAFEGMESGFRARSQRASELLGASTTAYLVVTSLRKDALADAAHLGERLRATGRGLDAVVANRTHPSFGDLDATDYERRATELSTTGLGWLAANLAETQRQAEDERALLASLGETLGAGCTLTVPELPSDVHDMAGIAAVADHLVGD